MTGLDDEFELLLPNKNLKSWPVTIAVACVMILFPMALNGVGALGVGNVFETEWFKSIDIAPWSPPSWTFSVIWTFLFLSMGTSSFLIWHVSVKHGIDVTVPMLIYGVHLLVNAFWVPAVFGHGQFSLGLIDLMVMLALVLLCISLFWPISRTAAILLIPYATWLVIANSLNLYLVLHNIDGRPSCQRI